MVKGNVEAKLDNEEERFGNWTLQVGNKIGIKNQLESFRKPKEGSKSIKTFFNNSNPFLAEVPISGNCND